MRLDGPESRNVEDRRGQGFGGRGIAVGGGLGGVVLLVIALLLGVDPSVLLEGNPGAQQGSPGAQRQLTPEDEAGRRFVAQVLGETEQVWHAEFSRLGRSYEEPTLVLFSGATQSGCGFAQAQMGPFYCPNDRKVYIDLDFMADLQRRLRAGGDFAAAYIVAHEVGHHVQNLFGVLGRADQVRRGRGEAESNAIQVRIELQADCLAGAWARRAHETRNILDKGDIEEGLNAAAAVGDDRIQRAGQGYVVPESFTHGSSAQRVRWFRRGLETGRLDACDTFAAGSL
ncbi:KPN_02809 family neutral zinc metallopeptidase [Neoroseomonas soli]|uniref:Zinc metallopeptidase n=1 Tax=Neoroseomonas soli TaxID=1081025 RepID=A0A9X9WUG6_9PROT|nr:neutral zinc metallopeptidase [Neoroseomonas soli]MBR0670795.1 zinc metallopeptidase [Neoroseomonas soli]